MGWGEADRLAEDGAVGVEGGPLGAEVLGVGVLGRLLGRPAEPRHRLRQLALLEVVDGLGQGDDVVAVAAALHALDAGAHLALADDGHGAVLGEGGAQGAVEGVDVLAVHVDALDPVPLQRLGHVVALEVVGGVPGDGDIVVVDDELRQAV